MFTLGHVKSGELTLCQVFLIRSSCQVRSVYVSLGQVR